MSIKKLPFAVKIAILVFMVTLVISLIFLNSLNQFFFDLPTYFAGILLALTLVCFYWKSKNKRNEKAKYWLLFGSIIGMAYGFIAWRLSSIFLEFVGSISFVLVAFLFSLFLTFLAYLAAESISLFSRRILLLIASIFFITGFTTAIAFTMDHYWWRSSICSLGMPFNGTPFYYNFTMVMTGLLFTLFFIYLRTDLVKLKKKGMLTDKQLKISALNYFTVIALIILVGALPYGYDTFLNELHVRAAQLVYVFFGTFIFFMPKLMPIFSRKFDFFSYFILGFGLILYVFFNPLGFYSMAVFEIITIVMMAVWFYEFLRNIDLLKR